MIFQVPVIAVFTKFDQFKDDIKMKLQDEGCDAGTDFDTEVESVFNRRYLASLSGPPPFVRLESEYFFSQFPPILISVGMHKDDQQCTDLLEVTANALSGGVLANMLLAKWRDNLELNIRLAIIR